MTEKTYEFEARLIRHPKQNATFIEFPHNVEEEFGTRGQVKVDVQIDGVHYRGSLAKMGWHCHCLGVTQAIRQQIGKGPGESVHVRIQRDIQPRVVEVPDDLQKLLAANQDQRQFFEALSFTHRKEYVRWIESAKKVETRQKRLQKTIELLGKKVKHP